MNKSCGFWRLSAEKHTVQDAVVKLRLCRGLSVTGLTFHLHQMLSGALEFVWRPQGNGLNGITRIHNAVEGEPQWATLLALKRNPSKR